MPQAKAETPVVSFGQFYAALELRRAFSDRPVEMLSERNWRRVWGELGPTARTMIYLIIGVGLDQTQAARELGYTRGNTNNAYTQLKRVIRAVVAQDDIQEM